MPQLLETAAGLTTSQAPFIDEAQRARAAVYRTAL